MLRQFREEAGLTQRAMAAKLQAAHVWVHKSEIGERRVEITEFLDRCFAYGVNSGEALVELRLRRHF